MAICKCGREISAKGYAQHMLAHVRRKEARIVTRADRSYYAAVNAGIYLPYEFEWAEKPTESQKGKHHVR